jgi:hypothetical protein
VSLDTVKKMNRKSVILIFIFICVPLGLTGCFGPGDMASETETRYYTPVANQVIDIINSNGIITIQPTNSSKIMVQAEKITYGGSDDLKNINFTISVQNNHIQIKTVTTGFSAHQRVIAYTISIPYNVIVGEVSTHNGYINISDVKGDVVASSTNGQIIMKNVDGYVTATTSNGRIKITGTSGIKTVKTSNSQIEVEIYDLEDTTDIITSNSRITALLLPTLNMTLDAQTSNSQITIQGINLNVSTMENTHVVGKLGTGEKHLTLRTSNSGITISSLEIIPIE